MKTRYIHLRSPVPYFSLIEDETFADHHPRLTRVFDYNCVNAKGGATIKIVPQNASGEVLGLQFAFCSPLDAFCRKEGRETAEASEVVEINRDQLPIVLSAAYEEMLRNQHIPRSKRQVPDFSNFVKYFTPKENNDRGST